MNSTLRAPRSAPIPPGYKQTEVGVIPEEWEVARLGQLKPFVTSGSRGWASFYSERGDLFVRITNLSRGSIYLDLTDCKFVKLPPEAREGVRTQLNEHDVLISITADIGIVGYVDAGVPSPAYINQHIALVRFDSSKTNGLFVSYFLASDKPQKLFRATTDTGAKAGMSLLTVQRIQTALPPLPEQRAIAEALSDVDELLGGLDRLIAKKRDLKQAAMQHLLTPPSAGQAGQTRLPGFHGEWEIKRLGSLLRFQVGFPFSSAFFNEKNEGIRLVKNRDLKSDDQVFHYNGKYEEAFVVHDGDVLIGMDGDFLPCQWNKGPALLNQRVGRVVPNTGLNVAFAFYALIEPLKEIEIVTSSTTVKHLSHGDVEGIERPLPELPEQTAIAEVLTDMDAELATLEQRREKTRALKQAMMQELLTGRTRLV